MEISSLPISSSHRGKLLGAGYATLASLSSVSPIQLSQELNITLQEADGILKISSESRNFARCNEGPPEGASLFSHSGAKTAWDILSEERSLRNITTGSQKLDAILGGGVHCSEVTEVGGAPGIGKTQLGIQLAVNVQIPIDCGGLGGKAVYIDTEGSFMVERAYQIAEACIKGTLDASNLRGMNVRAPQEKMHPNIFLSNIFYFRICSYTEQIAVINYLDKFLEEQKNVRVVIIDSITFHFRQDFDDLALRTRVLSGISLKLMKLAKKYCCAVLLLNQVTTKFSEGSFQLTLALGDSWSHACTNRIILYWNGDERCAYIDKSPSLPSASTPFSVTCEGIRDVFPQYKRARTT